MKKIRILIVEDEAIIALETETTLRSLGYEIAGVVNTGTKAIETANSESPDIILMDIRIKGEIDGIQAADAIRSQLSIPVVFSTAYLDKERIERAKVTMPFGYVLKPIQERELKVTIEMALYTAAVDRDRRRAELVSTENEKQYHDLFNSMLDGFALHEMLFNNNGEPCDYRFLKVNPAFEKLTGLKAKDIIGKTVLEIVPDIEKRWIETYGNVVTTGEPIRFENFTRTLNRHFEVNAYRSRENQFACAFRDITQQKKAMEQQKRSEDIVNNIQVGLYIYQLEDLTDDTTFRMVYANRASEVLTGIPVKELVGNTFDENFPGVREKGLPQKYAEVVRTKKSLRLDDLYFSSKNKIEAWYSIRAFPLPDQCVGAAFEDITEQKKTEQALSESENRLKQAQKLAKVGHWDLFADTGELRWSDEVYSIFGRSKNTFQVTEKNFEKAIHPDDFDDFIRQKQRALAEKRDFDVVHRIIRPDGSIRCVHEIGEIIRDENNEVLRIMGVVQDVTEREARREERAKEVDSTPAGSSMSNSCFKS